MNNEQTILEELKKEPPERRESPDALVQKTICVSPDMKKACDMLVKMHTFMRPSDVRSKTERRFIHDYIQPLGVRMDTYGNYYKRIAGAPILWACHTDTVHDKKGMQVVGFDKMDIGLVDKSDSNCLGADDTVGVWLLIQMIKERRPGLYIFHRDEESGRKGSQYIAKETPELLKGIDFAVALDRRGTDNFITHQMGRRCCSEDFGKGFLSELKKGGLDYKLDDTGSFTDTASYTDLIAECTNISVGYTSAHSKNERLDLGHAFKLRDALLTMDLSVLEKKRVPGTTEYKSYHYTGSYQRSGSYWSNYKDTDFSADTDFDGAWIQDPNTGVWRINPKATAAKGTLSGTQVGTRNGHNGSNFPVTKQNSTLRKMFGGGTDTQRSLVVVPEAAAKPEDTEDTEKDEVAYAKDYDAMVKLVSRNPEAIADMLEGFGVDAETLRDEILDMCGICNF